MAGEGEWEVEGKTTAPSVVVVAVAAVVVAGVLQGGNCMCLAERLT